MLKRVGQQTIKFSNPPYFAAFASAVGKKEGQGPLKNTFDKVFDDTKLGQKTWEQAESELQKTAFNLACSKANIAVSDCQYILAGDLLNQCIGTAFANRDTNVPFFGLYGACSTIAESLILGSCLIDGDFADTVLTGASSHFCSAERQYRFPLAYGGQRTPTAQWTATAAGGAVLSSTKKQHNMKITYACAGKIVDMGVKDANNMGGAMAPSAYDTLSTLLNDTSTTPNDYDLIVTGDLGKVGYTVLRELFKNDGVDISKPYNDCGVMMFDDYQDAHAGASGCGCSASVLCGYILREMDKGNLKKVIFSGTGALMSPTSVQQGQSIPGICHAVVIEA